MRTSDQGIALLHHFEGCRLEAYPDPGTGGDPWTIGWGDTGPDVVPGLVITQAEADRRFADRLAREFEPGVLAAVRVPLTQHQFDALVSLAYNIGLAALNRSTLLRKLNTGDYVGARAQFGRWTRAGGRAMRGLQRRRAAEAAMFGGADVLAAIAAGDAAVRMAPAPKPAPKPPAPAPAPPLGDYAGSAAGAIAGAAVGAGAAAYHHDDYVMFAVAVVVVLAAIAAFVYLNRRDDDDHDD